MSTIPPAPADSGSSVKDSSVKDATGKDSSVKDATGKDSSVKDATGSSVREPTGSSVREATGTMYRISLEAGSSSEYQQTNLVTGFVRPGMLTDAHGCSRMLTDAHDVC